jgi:hypothetical protein
MKRILSILILCLPFVGCTPTAQPQAPANPPPANNNQALEEQRAVVLKQVRTAQDLLKKIDEKGGIGTLEVSKASIELYIPIYERWEVLVGRLKELDRQLGIPETKTVLTEDEKQQLEKFIADTEKDIAEVQGMLPTATEPIKVDLELTIKYGQLKIKHWEKRLSGEIP